MKIVTLNKHQAALVFRNQGYYKVLTFGTHLLRITDEVFVYELSGEFNIGYNIDILLEDPKFTSLVDIHQVKDEEIGLLFENGLFKTMLSKGRYIYWKSNTNCEVKFYNTSILEVQTEVTTYLSMCPLLLERVIVQKVENHESAILVVDGKVEKELDPGTYFYWKNTRTVAVTKADMRVIQLELNGQEILTSDKANLRLNVVAQYKVTNLMTALIQSKDYEKQLYVRLQLAYREFISKMKFDELLDNKNSVADYIKANVENGFNELGATLIHTGIRDIILPGEVKDIMNQVLVAEKKAQANVVMRREETAATRSLLNTAKLMEENEMLWRLKEMEYVEKIADKVNSVSLNNNGGMLEQLRQIFSARK